MPSRTYGFVVTENGAGAGAAPGRDGAVPRRRGRERQADERPDPALEETARSLTARPYARFPDWRCSHLGEGSSWYCPDEATWQVPSGDGRRPPRLFCEAHRPAAAERIPEDAPYRVLTVTVRLAVAAQPGALDDGRARALQMVAHALRSVGAHPTHITTSRRRAELPASSAPMLRMNLAGPAEPVDRRARADAAALELTPREQWAGRGARRRGRG